ncbi:MAG TPA: putative metal-dependent hydrolase [Longimicrobiales bacterium]|nr:putative metal-dependent hydrolase [Longimicrobiales bacterium]
MTRKKLANDLEDLRYPIGRFEPPKSVSDEEVRTWTDQIEVMPDQMRAAVARLTEAQLDTAYRPGGWTIRQVVHHVPDSHLNGYIRFKWALTEEEPVIKTYEEARWAELADSRVVPVATSLDLLALLHARWVALMRALSRDELSRRYRHPAWGSFDLGRSVALYAWHGRHHVAHIERTVEREGW